MTIVQNGKTIDLDKLMAEAGESEPVKTANFKETFTAKELALDVEYADICIQPAEDGKVTVEATGSEAQIKHLIAKLCDQKVLVIVRGCNGSVGQSLDVGNVQTFNMNGGCITIASGNSRVHVGQFNNGGSYSTTARADSIVINTQNSSSTRLQLKVQVPEDLPIELTGVSIAANFGDMQNHLALELSGSSECYARGVKDLKAVLANSSNVTIDSVGKNVSLDLSDSSQIKLGGSMVALFEAKANGSSVIDSAVSADELRVRVFDSSRVNVAGVVTDARLKSYDTASIYVRKVTGRCRKEVYDVSRIAVGE